MTDEKPTGVVQDVDGDLVIVTALDCAEIELNCRNEDGVETVIYLDEPAVEKLIELLRTAMDRALEADK